MYGGYKRYHEPFPVSTGVQNNKRKNRCERDRIPAACLRLIGMLLVEKHEDRLTDDKAYLTFDDAPAEDSAAKVVSMAAGLKNTRGLSLVDNHSALRAASGPA